MSGRKADLLRAAQSHLSTVVKVIIELLSWKIRGSVKSDFPFGVPRVVSVMLVFQNINFGMRALTSKFSQPIFPDIADSSSEQSFSVSVTVSFYWPIFFTKELFAAPSLAT